MSHQGPNRCFCSPSRQRHYLRRLQSALRVRRRRRDGDSPTPSTSGGSSSSGGDDGRTATRDALDVLVQTDHLVRTLYASSSGKTFCRGVFTICNLLHDTKFILLSALFRLDPMHKCPWLDPRSVKSIPNCL